MADKAKTPAPIDRPLSRAYLREFTGWSSAYPPGISDPTSLRVMENVMIERDGACSIRPGLRYLSYLTPPADDGSTPGTAIDAHCVGTHEPFFLNNGSKAYLFAVYESDGTVGFRVLGNTGSGMVVHQLTDAGIDFTINGVLAWPGDVTYVKYLQIDNKIFALNNAGHPMRYFEVGDDKAAKALQAISRPSWTVADKLTVVHPDAAWISTASAATYRTNYAVNPSFEVDTYGWLYGSQMTAVLDTAQHFAGGKSLRVTSNPSRTNLIKNPVSAAGTYGINEWSVGTGVNQLSNLGGLKIFLPAGAAGRHGYANSSKFDVTGGDTLQVALDLVQRTNMEASGDALGLLVRFYNSSGTQVGADRAYNWDNTIQRRVTGDIPVPTSAVKMTVHPYMSANTASAATFTIANVWVGGSTESSAFFSGASGTNYFWLGTAGRSASVYHPPQDVRILCGSGGLYAGSWTASAYFRAGSTPRNCSIDLMLFGGSGVTPVTTTGTPAADATGAWGRRSATATMPAGGVQYFATLLIPGVPRGEYHYIDAVLVEQASSAGTYFDGNTADTPTLGYGWSGTAHKSSSSEQTFSVGGSVPPAETKTADTLISSVRADNDFSFGFFYTFSTEVGESAASQVTIARAQRGWATWLWETPNAAGEPSGTATSDGDLAADQLVAYMPHDVYDQAIAEGALSWNLYMFTWSNEDVVPVTAVRINSRKIDLTKPYSSNSWIRVTPMLADTGNEYAQLPTRGNRKNYTDPSNAGNGIVAADRMIVVYDPVDAAVIRWTGNNQGAYTDFTASRGGGYKTLTSGNIYVPATVKLWQNSQSVDTLTILCLGVDGYSTCYYMAPAQVASQSAAVNIMGFEETTATPGTVSPYGCEVLNNVLYHPQDENILKSSVTMYNVNHSTITDQIQNMWRLLSRKDWIVSSVCDNRIYFLVFNPTGAPLEDGCRGNEVWVFDGAQKAGSWSRWLTQGVSLRKIQQGGQVGMSLIRPDGIYFFEDGYAHDDFVDGATVSSRAIPWYIETNTQGANRAHDAWCHLQQANIIVGNFTGVMRYGVKGLDVHGKWRDIGKQTRDANPPSTPGRFDLEDFLLIRRDLREWIFYAGSVTDDSGTVQVSSGQIDLVQYKYAPVTVNVGYEFGSIETFEYGRAALPADSRTSDNGVPMPYVDTRRP